jgi:methionine sulfoxide reductase heme-binding subunit
MLTMFRLDGLVSNWLWFLNRASGIVALILGAGALIGGFAFSARETGKRLRPNWWLDLHNWLGGSAFVFTIVHIVAVYADKAQHIGLKQVFIPGTAAVAGKAITVGVLATYSFGIAVLTSWPKRLFSRRTWRIVHLLSIPGSLLAALHALWIGSDALTSGFRVLAVVLAGLVLYPAVIRLYRVVAKGRALS